MIDCHLHLQPNIGLEEISTVFNRYNIKTGLISNLEPATTTQELITLNKKVLTLCQQGANLYCLFFCEVSTCSFTNEVGVFILNNLDFIKGLKIHPSGCQISVLDIRYHNYFEFAIKHRLPVMIHTDETEYCNIKSIKELNIRYPDLTIIMAHMAIDSNHEEAINLIQHTNNVYGDISWVTYENVLKIMKHCSSDKILFGTDAPFDGELGFNVTPLDPNRADFKWYRKHFMHLNLDLSKLQYQDLMYENAKRLFNL
ncbi:MAG: amidohydrolase family protein [Turicibacter sp.]